MTKLMGFDVTHVPTADLMELAAKILEVDAKTITRVYAMAGADSAVVENNRVVADLLRERARAVRALEMAPGELDS